MRHPNRTRPRRLAIAALAAVVLATGCSTQPTAQQAPPPPAPGAAAADEAFLTEIRAIEERFDARIGVSAVEVTTGRTLDSRGDERFGFASTMKAYAAALLLDATSEAELDERIAWTSDDVEAAGYSPVTELAVADGLTLGELAEAAVRESDNTAMNLVIGRLGGPDGLQRGLRAAGDATSRPVDVEPGLNDVVAGDDANTSTPNALAASLRRIAAGEWLAAGDRERLLEWMSGNATGDTLIRAGVPAEWQVMDKSGGAGPIRNDVAVLRGPGGEEVVIVVLTEKRDPDAAWDDEAVAAAADAALTRLLRAG